jgi:hypothetical protein
MSVYDAETGRASMGNQYSVRLPTSDRTLDLRSSKTDVLTKQDRIGHLNRCRAIIIASTGDVAAVEMGGHE